MKRTPNQTRRFISDPEPVVNPYLGFTSYQKFRGDPLFEDVVVRPENGMTETEATECYPVPDAAGTAPNGYYPDTTVAYIRVLWKSFEPDRKEYDYGFIDDILRRAGERDQTVMLRLMPHSTRAGDDVPDWLRELIPCPERPDGRRVKDSPKDPLFLKYFGEAVEALAMRFDSDPTLDVIDISLPGAWGEGYRLGDYPEDALEELIDVYTRSFRSTRLIGQASSPKLVKYACGTAPCGWRGDGTGEPKHLAVKYPAAAAFLSEQWKHAPISFESYWWLGEWDRQGWDIDEVIEKTLEWHVSTFNAKSFPIPEKWRGRIDGWLRRMGYHFHLREFSYPDSADPGDELVFGMCVENRGVAPIYNAVPLRLRLSGEGVVYDFVTDVDVREWLPGDNSAGFYVFTDKDMIPGEYEVGISLSGDNTPVVRFETQCENDGVFIRTGRIRIDK